MSDVYRRIDVSKQEKAEIAKFRDKKILDETALDELRVELLRLINDRQGLNLLLDFSNVEFMSSAVLGLLGQGETEDVQHSSADLRGLQAHEPQQVVRDPQGPGRGFGEVLIRPGSVDSASPAAGISPERPGTFSCTGCPLPVVP
jgi:hypothetical protein